MNPNCCICYTRLGSRTFHDQKKILHNEEMKQARGYSGVRKMEYTAGRFAAKQAYLILTGRQTELNSIYIANDYLGAPYFMDARYSCSISHNKEFAVGAVADVNKLRIGIDVQELGSIKKQLIDYYINDTEKNILSDWNTNYDEDYLFNVVWCAKEAISKLFQHGFGLFGVLEVERMTFLQNHLSICFKGIRNICVCIKEIENSLVAVAAHVRLFDKSINELMELRELEF